MAFTILILRFPANKHGTRLDAEAHTADMAEKLQNTFGSSAGNANENNFMDWLESSSLKEYAAQFSENGYDDLDLLKTLNEGESKAMIKNLKIEKPGHVLKIKKCIDQLKNAVLIKSVEKEIEKPTIIPWKTQSSRWIFNCFTFSAFNLAPAVPELLRHRELI